MSDKFPSRLAVVDAYIIYMYTWYLLINGEKLNRK
jgi:hypothetical protein